MLLGVDTAHSHFLEQLLRLAGPLGIYLFCHGPLVSILQEDGYVSPTVRRAASLKTIGGLF